MPFTRAIVVAALALAMVRCTAPTTDAAQPPPKVAPGTTITAIFPEMPPTFYDLSQKKDVKAQMTVFLPTDYEPGRKHPLLVFLGGGDGGTGTNPAVARALTAEKDFVCVSVPLFKVTAPNVPGGEHIMRDPDGKYMWPFFRTMLTKVEELVPNINPAHRVLQRRPCHPGAHRRVRGRDRPPVLGLPVRRGGRPAPTLRSAQGQAFSHVVELREVAAPRPGDMRRREGGRGQGHFNRC
jgi:hypothetical protein